MFDTAEPMTEITELDFSGISMKKDEIDDIIIHARCPDGSSAAAYAYVYYRDKRTVPRFHPASYDTEPNYCEFAGKNVALFDFSYPKEIMQKLLDVAKNVFVGDHHKSAEKELEDFPDDKKVFDMTHCGASIAFRFYFPDRPIPLFLRYIHDRDLWHNKMPDYAACAAWISSLPFSHHVYGKYVFDDEMVRYRIDSVGKPMDVVNQSIVKSISSTAGTRLMARGSEVFAVAVVNCPIHMRSEVGNEVIKRYDNCDFVSVFSSNEAKGTTRFSFRSLSDCYDVTKIGKGHRNASGAGEKSTTVTVMPAEFSTLETNIYDKLASVYSSVWTLNEFGFTIAYVTTDSHPIEWCYYLMRDRHGDRTGDASNATHLLQKKGVSTRKVDISVAYHQDPVTSSTYVTMLLSPDLSDSHLHRIVEHVGVPCREYLMQFKYQQLTNALL